VAALLHDIGKVAWRRTITRSPAPSCPGRRSDHSVDWGFSPDADRALVVRLVREHLTLVELATRRDHHDPATVACGLSAAVDGSLETSGADC
jgi:[protein-PII] uridylyltransferase